MRNMKAICIKLTCFLLVLFMSSAAMAESITSPNEMCIRDSFDRVDRIFFNQLFQIIYLLVGCTFFAFLTFKSVSYTHLDVYKRQGLQFLVYGERVVYRLVDSDAP